MAPPPPSYPPCAGVSKAGPCFFPCLTGVSCTVVLNLPIEWISFVEGLGHGFFFPSCPGNANAQLDALLWTLFQHHGRQCWARRPSPGRQASPQEQRRALTLPRPTGISGMWGLACNSSCLHLEPFFHRNGPGLCQDRPRCLSPGPVAAPPSPLLHTCSSIPLVPEFWF